jgi:hypothetical protein
VLGKVVKPLQLARIGAEGSYENIRLFCEHLPESNLPDYYGKFDQKSFIISSKQIESKVVRIAELQEIFTEKVRFFLMCRHRLVLIDSL